MKKHKYFTLNELCRSNTASKYGIDNTPTSREVLDNLDYTMNRLDEIREGYGKPIIINSGYRCKELNERVGGKPTSQHLRGEAVDIAWDSALFDYILDNHGFDQLIREKSNGTRWIHISFKKLGERKQAIFR